MSQRGSLDHIQIEPIVNTLGANANKIITFAQVGSSQKVLIQDTPSRESEILQKLLQELESSSVQSNRCSVHPEEDIQFYCYTNGSTLCAECLLKRNYTGLEVMNLRRAAEKLKGDLGGIISQAFSKIESTNAFQQETERYHHHTEEVIEGYREEVQRKMTAIREALAIKEKELMDRLNAIKRERVNILSGSSGSPQRNQDEIRALKELIEFDVKGFSDLALCKFYSKKLGTFRGQQGEEIEENVQNERDMMEYFESQDQANFSKFEENLHEILTDIQTLSCEVINNRYNPIAVHLESLESASMERLQQFQRNVYSSYTVKESIPVQRERANNPISIITTSRPHHQKVTSFLSSPLYGENDIIKSHTNLSSKPSLITDLYRDRTESVAVTTKSSYAPIINNYREQLAKVASARTLGSSSNRNSIIDIAGILGNQEKQQQQCQSAKPRITPQKFFIETGMTSRTPRLASARPRALEASVDQVEYAMTARASSQKGILKYPGRTDSNSKKEFGLIGFDKTTFLTSPKVQSKVTTIEIPSTSTSEKGNLRQRLSNLNAKLFN